jgi:hypothetical protein
MVLCLILLKGLDFLSLLRRHKVIHTDTLESGAFPYIHYFVSSVYCT